MPGSRLGLPADVRRRTLHEGGLPIRILWRLSRGSFARRQAAAFGPSIGARVP